MAQSYSQAFSGLSCPGSDGSQFTAGNSVFNIHCGIDYYGNDIGRAGDATDFESCITICSTTSDCVDVNWTNGNCYLKKVALNSVPDSSAWTATLASTDSANAARVQCPRDDGTTYTTPSGDQYQISCDKYYPGGDLSSKSVDTFEDCLAACDGSMDCTDFTFNHGNCYLKNSNSAPGPETGSISAKLTHTAVACPRSNGAVYSTDDGHQYQISCATDFQQGDLSSYYEPSFENCIKTCDATPECIDLSYHHSFCYMKNVQTAGSYNGESWSAQLISTISCPASDGATYNTASGDEFQVQCGTDYLGGDIAGAAYFERSFQKCLETCDTTDGCVGVAYHHNYCYPKDGSVSASSNPDSWAAKKIPGHPRG